MTQRTAWAFAFPFVVAGLAGCGGAQKDSDNDTDSLADTDVSTDTGSSDDSGTSGDSGTTDDTGASQNVCGDLLPASDAPCFVENGLHATNDGGEVTALALAEWDGNGPDLLFGVGSQLRWASADSNGKLKTDESVVGGGTPIDFGSIIDIKSGFYNGADTYTDLVLGVPDKPIAYGDGLGGVTSRQYDYASEGTHYELVVADMIGSPAGPDVLSCSEYSGLTIFNGGLDGDEVNTDYFTNDATDITQCTLAKTSSEHTSAITAISDLDARTSVLRSYPITADGSTSDLISAAVTVTLPAATREIVSADLDADGDDDSAVLGSDGNVYLLFSDGADAWEPQGSESYVAVSVAASVADMVGGDWDHDGDYDLAVSSPEGNAVVLMVNDGLGVFTQQTIALTTLTWPSDLAAGDLNEDGHIDIFVTGSLPTSPFVAGLVVMRDQILMLRANP